MDPEHTVLNLKLLPDCVKDATSGQCVESLYCIPAGINKTIPGMKWRRASVYLIDQYCALLAYCAAQDLMDIVLGRPIPWRCSKKNVHRYQGRCTLVYWGQNQTKPLIIFEGEPDTVLKRILARKHKITGLWLIQDEDDLPLRYEMLRCRFHQARQTTKVKFQFRDIRAKAATDTENLSHAQKLLGHKTCAMTKHYTRNRKGEKVTSIMKRVTLKD